MIESGLYSGEKLGAIYLNRGLVYERVKKDHAAAISDFSKAISLGCAGCELQPYRVYAERGAAYFKLGDYQRSINDFSEAIQRSTETVWFVSNSFQRALAYRAQQQYDKAIADYDEILRRNPKADSAILDRALANLEAGRPAAAQVDLRRKGLFLPIWSYIVEARQGNDNPSRIKAEAAKDKWAVYDLFLGRATPEDVISAAASKPYVQSNERMMLVGLCEAKTYIGEWYLLKKQPAQARDQFRFVVDKCKELHWPFTYVPTAIAELAHLQDEPTPSAASGSPPASNGTLPGASGPNVVEANRPANILDVAASLGGSIAGGGVRIALVIGNSRYRNVPVLANPVHDAEMVAEVLKRTGFASVTLLEDLSKDAMVTALHDFAAEAEKADWAVVYYAGHGMEVGGVNYLIPVDARLATDRDVSFEAVPLDQVLNAAERASKLRLVILDACRDNPFKSQMKRTLAFAASRSVSVGLAPVEPDPGTLVVYAAKGGERASDGDGDHGPFAAALVKDIVVPGLEIRRLFDVVRDDVLEITHHEQQPFSYGSISGRQDFYFVNPGGKGG
jgi:tetratricopeptide (TPR) repeat protein